MPKAAKPVMRPRIGRKARAPFTLNIEARKLLRAHQKLEAVEQAFRAAAAAEKDADDYTPATVALRDEWHAGMKRLTAAGDALAERAAKKLKPTLADCLALAVAGWHSKRADRECVRAVLAVAGIDMTDAGR